VLTPWYEKVSVVLWLGLSLGYLAGLLLLGAWWYEVQAVLGW
jgi:hypothetical protein